jgi:hypothetical protein
MEDMIRRRIKEGNFSDVLPPPPRKDGDADETGNHRLSLIERVKPRVYMRARGVVFVVASAVLVRCRCLDTHSVRVGVSSLVITAQNTAHSAEC